MVKSKIGALSLAAALSVLTLTGTALIATPASAATNCLQPESVPYSLTHVLTALEQSNHHNAIVACQQRQARQRQVLSAGQRAADAPVMIGDKAHKPRL